MTEHVHEWKLKTYLYVGIPIFTCSDDDCAAMLSVKEAESRLNEYETLKKATEAFSVDSARIASIVASKLPIEFDEIRDNLVDDLKTYADILEGE